MKSIIGIGSPLVDGLSHVDEAFISSISGDKGGTELIELPLMEQLISSLPGTLERAPGGSAANTIVGLASLGMTAKLLGKIGADQEGAYYSESLRSAGVDTSALKIHNTEATGRCLSLITPDSQRTMRTFLGAAACFTPQNICEADFENVEHAHIEGYLLFNEQLMINVLQTAKSCGCTISLDLAAPEVVAASKNKLPGLLAEYVDMVFANEDEAANFCGSKDEKTGLDALSHCCDTAVVKLGKRGAMIQSKGKIVSVDAEIVQAVDTTGAGDLWASGFLYGILSNLPPQICGNIGSAVAAEVVKVTGASIPDSEWKTIISKIETYFTK